MDPALDFLKCHRCHILFVKMAFLYETICESAEILVNKTTFAILIYLSIICFNLEKMICRVFDTSILRCWLFTKKSITSGMPQHFTKLRLTHEEKSLQYLVFKQHP